jgi:hypothetical protein
MKTDRHTQRVKATIFVLLGIFSLPAIGWALPAFPGAVGFGSTTPGGRGGKVIEVTNLNDSGAGSLRAALEASGPRIVVFRTGGTIQLTSNIKISNPYITIAGQTAPGGGITLRGRRLAVNTHDVLVQHIRVRVGDQGNPGDIDAITTGNESYNVVIDHVSASWGIDEQISSYGNTTHDVTISNSIMAQGLNDSIHSEGPHSKGSTTKYATRVSHIQNLYAHNEERNPRCGDTDLHAMDWMVVNSVIYNWGNKGTDVVTPSGPFGKRVNIVGNVYKSGVDSNLGNTIVVDPQTGTQVYIADNMRNGVVPSDPWSIVKGDTSTRVPSPPFPLGFTPKPAAQVQAFVLANVGARPTARDAIDAQVVTDVQNGTGHIIDSQNEVGGWPTLATGTPLADSDHDGMPDSWETSHGLNPNSAADGSQDQDGDGYTNVEEYIHSLFSNPSGGTSLTPPTNLNVKVIN